MHCDYKRFFLVGEMQIFFFLKKTLSVPLENLLIYQNSESPSNHNILTFKYNLIDVSIDKYDREKPINIQVYIRIYNVLEQWFPTMYRPGQAK